MSPHDRPDLPAIRARLEKLAGTPWRIASADEQADQWCGHAHTGTVIVSRSGHCGVAATNDDGIATQAEFWNAEFIAHAPTDIATLLAMVETLTRHYELTKAYAQELRASPEPLVETETVASELDAMLSSAAHGQETH